MDMVLAPVSASGGSTIVSGTPSPSASGRGAAHDTAQVTAPSTTSHLTEYSPSAGTVYDSEMGKVPDDDTGSLLMKRKVSSGPPPPAGSPVRTVITSPATKSLRSDSPPAFSTSKLALFNKAQPTLNTSWAKARGATPATMPDNPKTAPAGEASGKTSTWLVGPHDVPLAPAGDDINDAKRLSFNAVGTVAEASTRTIDGSSSSVDGQKRSAGAPARRIRKRLGGGASTGGRRLR